MCFEHKEEHIGKYWIQLCSNDEKEWYVEVEKIISEMAYYVVGYEVEEMEKTSFETRIEAEFYFKECILKYAILITQEKN